MKSKKLTETFNDVLDVAMQTVQEQKPTNNDLDTFNFIFNTVTSKFFTTNIDDKPTFTQEQLDMFDRMFGKTVEKEVNKVTKRTHTKVS